MKVPARQLTLELLVVNEIRELAKFSFSRTVRRALVIGLTSVDHFRIEFLESGLAAKLATNGFRVFAIVGPGSEHAHDELDWVLEDLNFTDALTTWHDAKSVDDIVSYCEAMVLGNVAQLIAVLDLSVPAYSRLADELSTRLLDT